MRGLLRGMGREAECELLARRSGDSSPRSAQPVVYSDCVVLTAPADLPDGDYMLYFAGYSTMVTRVRGIWTSCGTAARDSSADGMEEGRAIDPAATGPAHSDARTVAPEPNEKGKTQKIATASGS